MNTETGRIYLPDEMSRRLGAKEDRVILDEHQAMFEKEFDEGKIVPVSDKVALQQLRGQASQAKHNLRKAQKAARKRNRK